LEDFGVKPARLGEEFLKHEGYGSFTDYINRVGELYGADEAERVSARMRELRAIDLQTLVAGDTSPVKRSRVLAAGLARHALIAGPDAEFLKGIGYAIGMVGRIYAQPGGMEGFYAAEEARAYIDELFAKRAVPYRYEEYGLVWIGDRGAHETVVAPALRALEDVRLAGARNEFEAALSHVRAGTQKDREDAIEEAAKSVESAMKVMAAEAGISVPARATARPLFIALQDEGGIPSYMEPLVLAASRIRNEQGGHGAGGSPRQIELDIATAAVDAAAAAIVFLAGRLP
jgi:hypothetical protein